MTEPSLPTDAFDRSLRDLCGLPNGAHVKPTVIQAQDFYGHTTQFITQTVKHDGGETVFVTQVNAAGSTRYILPPELLSVIDRQRDATRLLVKRRHGRRLAEERKAAGFVPKFTAEARRKAAVTRARKAAGRLAKRTK